MAYLQEFILQYISIQLKNHLNLRFECIYKKFIEDLLSHLKCDLFLLRDNDDEDEIQY